MHYKNVALFAATAAALPQGSLPKVGPEDKFGLIAIHSGSPVHLLSMTAAQGGFNLGGTNNASCDAGAKQDFATFSIDSEGNAFLYTNGAPYQQLFTDRSGMGQGVWGYTTGAQPAGRNSERAPWSINEDGHFVFDGKSPQACPPFDPSKGGWTVWWSDLEKPGYNENCTGIALRAVKADDPVGCWYSEGS